MLSFSLLSRYLINSDKFISRLDSFLSIAEQRNTYLTKFNKLVKYLVQLYENANLTNIILILFILIFASLASIYLLIRFFTHFEHLAR